MHPFCKGEQIFLYGPECKLELKNKFMICSIVRPSAQGGKKKRLLRSTGNTGHSVKEQRAVDANSFETFFIKDQIARCEDTEELRKVILPMIRTQQDQWIRKINEIVNTSGYSKSGFAELCGVSRVTLDKWLKGSIPKNRETFLRIGMAARYDVRRLDQLLQRYGQYPALYSKSLEDCVCRYVIERYCGRETIAKYQYILQRIRENIVGSGSTDKKDADTLDIATEEFDEKLSEIRDDDELEMFILENSAVFQTAYRKFYSYVMMFILVNYPGFQGSVYELAEGQGWSSSLRQCVSAIRQNKWYPTRNKIISLGLHLSMDHEQIDEMFALAHMEPLCAKNIFESVVMFILDDANLNNILDTESEEYDPDELCRYARDVMLDLNLPEVASFVSELSEIDGDVQ